MKDHSSTSHIVGREREIEQLRHLLVAQGAKVVYITGKRRIGKTTLAMEFVSRYGDEFPGGVTRIDCTPPFSFFAWLESQTKPSRSTGIPRLVIFDDMDELPPRGQLRNAFNQTLRGSRDTHYLVIRQIAPTDVQSDPVINVRGIPPAFVREFIESLPTAKDQEEVTKILSLLGNEEVSALQVLQLLSRHVYTPEDIHEALGEIKTGGILGPDGNPLSPRDSTYKKTIVEVKGISEELLRRVMEQPDLVYTLHPRQFEEFTAEIMKRHGFRVQLTPISRDGGKDIYIATKDTLGSFLYLVECKRYAPNRPVGIAHVQRLFGVVEAERATAGIFVTTSSFSHDAREFQNAVQYHLSLIDYIGLQQLLKSALARKK